jgi:transcriptional regulator with XRE-family HTH domain
MDIKKTFWITLRAYRQKLGMSQEAFGNKVKLHRTYVWNIERGEKNITLENIEKLAIALEIDIQDFFIKK